MACSSCRRYLWSQDRKSAGGGETRKPGNEHFGDLTLRALYCHDTNVEVLGELDHVLDDTVGRYALCEGLLSMEL